MGFRSILRSNKTPRPPLEPDAIDARYYGIDFKNEDRDKNGTLESYFKDRVTGIEYRVRINSAKELVLIPVGK